MGLEKVKTPKLLLIGLAPSEKTTNRYRIQKQLMPDWFSRAIDYEQHELVLGNNYLHTEKQTSLLLFARRN